MLYTCMIFGSITIYIILDSGKWQGFPSAFCFWINVLLSVNWMQSTVCSAEQTAALLGLAPG